MPICSECHKPTTIWQRDLFSGTCPECRGVGPRATPASLGCGTLILIAIIVAIFSQAGTQDLEEEVSRLRYTVHELKEAIDAQTDEIEQLRSKIDKLEPASAPGGAPKDR